MARSTADDVSLAARLGWSLAMLRGRLRVPPPAEDRPRRVEHALALAAERSRAEQLIELEAVLKSAAASLGLDVPVQELSYKSKDAKGTAGDWLETLAKTLARARQQGSSDEVAKAWEEAAVFFDSWNQIILDRLAATPPLSAAYQASRGIAEIRWAADGAVVEPTDFRSLAYLLGDSRRKFLNRALDQLTRYYDAPTIHALRTSLAAWGTWVVPATTTDIADAAPLLDDQSRLWHDLVVADRTATDLIRPDDFLKSSGAFFAICRHLWLELSILGASAALLLAAGAELASTSAHSSWATVAAILGLLGTSAGAAAARARSSAKGLLLRIREKIHLELAARSCTISPLD